LIKQVGRKEAFPDARLSSVTNTHGMLTTPRFNIQEMAVGLI